MTPNDLSLLMGLVLAHLVGDFLLQPRRWVDERMRRRHRSRHLLYHALVHAGLQEAPREAVREQVLLRLAHLRVHPPHAEEILAKALEAAQDADNHTLIGAVARAARLLGLALPEQTF